MYYKRHSLGTAKWDVRGKDSGSGCNGSGCNGSGCNGSGVAGDRGWGEKTRSSQAVSRHSALQYLGVFTNLEHIFETHHLGLGRRFYYKDFVD